MTNTGGFSTFTMLCNHHLSLVPKRFHQKKTPYSLSSCSPFRPAQPKANTNLCLSLRITGLFLTAKVMSFFPPFVLKKKKYSKEWKSLVHLLPYMSHFSAITTKRYGGHKNTHSYSLSSNGATLCLAV